MVLIQRQVGTMRVECDARRGQLRDAHLMRDVPAQLLHAGSLAGDEGRVKRLSEFLIFGANAEQRRRIGRGFPDPKLGLVTLRLPHHALGAVARGHPREVGAPGQTRGAGEDGEETGAHDSLPRVCQ
jgi:hypothetical protein